MERHCQRGFTLVELLVALVVAAILFGIAIPAFSELMEEQRSWTAMNDLRTGLHQAREYAVRNGTQVTVCRSADQAACMTGDLWNEGWIVFEDPSGVRDCSLADPHVCDHGGRVLSVSPGTGGRIHITANHFVKDSVRFYPEGFAMASNGTFTACNVDGDPLRGMILAWSGRVRVANHVDSANC